MHNMRGSIVMKGTTMKMERQVLRHIMLGHHAVLEEIKAWPDNDRRKTRQLNKGRKHMRYLQRQYRKGVCREV